MRKVIQKTKCLIYILVLSLIFLFFSCSNEIPNEIKRELGWDRKDDRIITFSRLNFSNNSTYTSLSYDKTHSRLYAGNNENKCVDILSLGGEYGESIYGFTLSGVNYGYKSITDVYIKDNLLFVTSILDNRVDVYSLDNGNIILSLGDGGQNAFNTTSLPNPKSVVMNDEYVFVSSYGNLINVYKRSDLKKENHLKCTKYAFLRLGEKNEDPSSTTKPSTISLDRKSNAYMEIIDDTLFLSEEDNTKVFLFNIFNIKKNEQRLADEVLNFSNRFHCIKTNGEYVYVSRAPGVLLLFNKEDFLSLMHKSPLNGKTWQNDTLLSLSDIAYESFSLPKKLLPIGNEVYLVTSGGILRCKRSEYEVK